jgi:hypothetical protein
MNTTGFAASCSTQTHFTRIAVSAAVAFAVMLVLYLVLTESPTLVEVHAALYRVFETQDQAWETIARGVLCFCIGMQLLIAYACARASQRSASEGTQVVASESYAKAGVFILWLAGVPLAFAIFSPDYFSVKGPNSWYIAGMLVLTQLIGLLAICVPFIDCDVETVRNRVMCFAVGKWLPCLVFVAFGFSKVTLTLIVGTFLLDLLLHPVGVVAKEAPMAPAPTADLEPAPDSGMMKDEPVSLAKPSDYES